MINNFKLYISDRNGVSNYHNKNITHMISIGDPGQKKPYINHFAVRPIILRQEYDDVITGDSSHLAPSEKDIKEIIDYSNKIKDLLKEGKSVNLITHCWAGIARSTAAGFIVLNVLIGPGKELDIFNYMLQDIRPCMIPNTLMVDYADKLLDRKGKMSSLAREYRNKFMINNAWSYE